MSGPKVDVAELREMERQRLERLRKRREKIMYDISKKLAEFKKMSAAYGDSGDANIKRYAGNIQKIQDKFMKELQALDGDVRNATEEADTDAIENRLQRVIQQCNAEMAGDLSALRTCLSANEDFRKTEENRKRLLSAQRREVVRLRETKRPETVTETVYQKESEAFSKDIEEFIRQQPMGKKHRESVEGFKDDLREIRQKKNLSLQQKENALHRLFLEFEHMKSFIKEDAKEMLSYYEDYKIVCAGQEFQPRALEKFASAQEIERELRVVDAIAQKKEEKEYIKRQVSEVMAAYGYNMVRSDVLEETQQAGQMLYGVNDSTGINVFVSDDNQVTMRVVGIGFDTSMTAAEDEELFRQQCHFCSMHPQITKDLWAKGVVLHERIHQPPDKKYNKKIQVSRQKSNGTASRAKKELKRGGQKALHREM